MEDYYTIENLKKTIRKSDFLKIQRAVYPIISEGKADVNLISQLLIENYFERLIKNGITIKNIDVWLNSCDNENLDTFIHLINPDISSKSFDEYSYNEMSYTVHKISNSIYNGFSFQADKDIETYYLGNKFYVKNFIEDDKGDLTPYVHYNYDKKMYTILSNLREKANIKYVSDELRKYGIDNFESLSYEEISTLLFAILKKNNYGIKFDTLIVKMYDVLKYYDKKMTSYDLNKLELRYLSGEKLERLCRILFLASMKANELHSMYESEIDMNIADMYEASVLKNMNEENAIINAYNMVRDEIRKRKESHFNNNVLYYANLISRDLNKNSKTKKLKI